MSAHRVSRILTVFAVATGAVVASAPPAAATFHLTKIRAVFAGVPGAPGAQYVMLQMHQPFQNLVAGTQLRVFNASGGLVATFTFPLNALVPTNQSTILAATAAAESFFGVQADLEMGSAALPPAGGKLCFHDPSAGGFGDIDCVSWGGYTGPTLGTGTPFNAPEGIPSGATAERVITGGTDPAALDAGDDTGNSAADFRFAPAVPRSNLGVSGSAPGGVLSFGTASRTASETAGAASITVTRTGGAGAVSARATSSEGTATAGSDYLAVDRTVTLAEGQGSQTVDVEVIDDARVEPAETVELRLRGPTGGAVLGAIPNATLTILDDEGPDVVPSVTEITRPAHRQDYRPSRIKVLRGTAQDAGSDIAMVEVALRQKKTNGTCRWWNGDGFVPRPCGLRLFQNAAGLDAWTYRLPKRLKRSQGTKIAFYTAFARSLDTAGNLEDTFEKGRNKNRFEVT